MFKIDGKYGNVHMNGMSIDIDKTQLQDLTKYLQELKMKRTQFIEKQNEYLSQIMK